MRSLALLMLLLCGPAIARNDHRHAVHQVYRAPVAWVPGFWIWRAVPLSPDEQAAMRGWRNSR